MPDAITESYHNANFVLTGRTASFHDDNRQRRKSWHHDNPWFLVMEPISVQLVLERSGEHLSHFFDQPVLKINTEKIPSSNSKLISH